MAGRAKRPVLSNVINDSIGHSQLLQAPLQRFQDSSRAFLLAALASGIAGA